MDNFVEFYKQQADVVIREEELSRFAARFASDAVLSEEFTASTRPLQFPLQFPSLQEEINLLALKELLMVGEGGWWL